MNRGHYCVFIKDLHSSCWYSCNDKLVFNVEENSVNNGRSYILFYSKVKSFHRIFAILQGGLVVSDIVFGCDEPTHNSSPVQELSLLTQFSGIKAVQSLVLEKECKGTWSSMVLPIRSDDPTYNPVHPMLTVVRVSVRRL